MRSVTACGVSRFPTLDSPAVLCVSGHPAAVVLGERHLDAQLEWLRGTAVPLAAVTAPDSRAPEQLPCCFGIDVLGTGPILQVSDFHGRALRTLM